MNVEAFRHSCVQNIDTWATIVVTYFLDFNEKLLDLRHFLTPPSEFPKYSRLNKDCQFQCSKSKTKTKNESYSVFKIPYENEKRKRKLKSVF